MKEYLFYTCEGYTTSPINVEVENCQLLGREIGDNHSQAKQKLLQNNPWIKEVGFDVSKILCVQLMDNTRGKSLI